MIQYASLGNSITSGVGATCMAKAYPALIISMLRSQSFPAELLVVARPGWTSDSLVHSLRLGGAELLPPANVISVMIGGDDLLQAGVYILRGASPKVIQDALDHYADSLREICRIIRRSTVGKLILMSQYNPFPNSPVAVNGIRRLNQIIQATSHEYKSSYAPVHVWFAGREAKLIDHYRTGRLEDALSGSSPIHPNNQGHLVIAEGLMPFIMQRSK